MSVQSVTPMSTTAAPPTTTAAPTPGTATTTADPAAAKKPGEVDIDPAQLRQWSTLSKAAREAKAEAEAAKARVAELEAKAGAKLEVPTLAEARRLGIPLEQLFEEWVKEGEAGTPAGDAEARAKLEAIEKRLNDEAEARTKDTEAQRLARYEASVQATDGLLTELLDEAEAPWKVSSRKENRSEAVSEARKLVENVVRDLQKANPTRVISDTEGDKLLRMALDEVEADLVEKGKRYNPDGATPANSTAPTPRTAPVARTTISNDRGTLRRPAGDPAKFSTFAEAKAELMQRLRSRKT